MKIGGQIPWNVIPIFETFKISCLMGKHHTRDVLGNHVKDRSFRLVHWLSIIPLLRNTSQESINLKRKFYLDCSSDTHCTWGEFGRVTCWLHTLRSWKRWTHQKSTLKDSMLNGKFMDESNFPEENQELRTPTLIREHTVRGEGHVDVLGESEGSLPPPQDSLPYAGEAINDFRSMSGNVMYRHHVEPRVKLYSPREESFPIPLKKNIDVSRTTHMNLDVKQERRIDDHWNIDGSRDLSDSWTGFTQFTLLEEKPPDGFLWSGGSLTRRQLTSTPGHSWPELWNQNGEKC